MNTQNHYEALRSLPEIINDIETDIEKRKHLRRFFEVMITICFTAMVILVSLLAFPQVMSVMDMRLIKFMLTELICFFPYVSIVALLFSLLGINKKSNSGLIIRIIIYNAALWVLATVIIAFAIYFAG
ncbi:MAG: hypothetical protein IKF09_00725 [Clostridiales bacterium]|nr:hypothetical protein [Clostridiales bacterium]